MNVQCPAKPTDYWMCVLDHHPEKPSNHYYVAVHDLAVAR